MSIHHIFIFSNKHDQGAAELLDLGFSEGESRTHPGQGTRNRKFYFKNFFLEILWVYKEDEIKREPALSAGLWHRSVYYTNDFSPFGLCINRAPENDRLFRNCIKYRPMYLPDGMAIDVIPNNDTPYLPWTFRWPQLPESDQKDSAVSHPNGVNSVTGITFGVSGAIFNNEYHNYFRSQESVAIESTHTNFVKLEFDKKRNNSARQLENLPLVIEH